MLGQVDAASALHDDRGDGHGGDKWRKLHMDNLFVDKKFFSQGWDARWMMVGVARRNRFPAEFAHKEVTHKEELAAVQNTVYAASYTEPKPEHVPDMVMLAISFYDSKPVLYLTTEAQTVEWLSKS